MLLLQAAPYIGVLFGLVCAGVYLYTFRTTAPVSVSGWRASRVATGDCPVEGCSGAIHMVAAEAHATLWKCKDCGAAYILSAIPGE